MKKRFMICLVLISICYMSGCNAEENTLPSVPAQPPTSSLDQSFGSREATQTPSAGSSERTDVKYSNEKTPEELITIRHSKTQLDQLQEEHRQGAKFTYGELSNELKFECIRKTDSGYYVVLMQDDGKRAFLFFDANLKFYILRRFADFITKDDFDFVKIGETTMEEVEQKDPNFQLVPFSSTTWTAHIVKEGGILIEYDLINCLWIVIDFDFFENSEIINRREEHIFTYSFPVILDIDK